MRSRFRCAGIASLRAEIALAAGVRGEEMPTQIRYLESYLTNEEIGARSLLVEEDYVDRHFLHEFVAYYATMLRRPPGQCTRIHVFTEEIGEDKLMNWIGCIGSEREALQSRIASMYLGYIVVRPLPFAPIGRTLLRPYPDDRQGRCYEPASTMHHVHFLGLDLSIKSLPFQQQDQAVGACATTALWVSLSRVMKADGHRAVTPKDVTEAATRHVVNGRAMPAVAGLSDEQVDSAVRAFGYEPYRFSTEARDNWSLFQLALKCYVTSGIPVLLRVRADRASGYHALVVAGIREVAGFDRQEPVKGVTGMGYRPIDRLYVHDDRLGPYARMVLVKGEDGEIPSLKLEPRREGYEELETPLDIEGGCVPLYTKLRLTAEDLVLVLADLVPLISRLFRVQLAVDLKFQLGGDYLAELATLMEDRVRLKAALLCARLSRYVGRVRLRDPVGRWRLDIVCDTTDIYRAMPLGHMLLMIVCADDERAGEFRRFCAINGIAALVP